jgi:hypothetical protein
MKVWDTASGMQISGVYQSGYAVLAISAVFTVMFTFFY